MLYVAILEIWTSTSLIILQSMSLLLVNCLLLTLDLFTTWHKRIAARKQTIFIWGSYLPVMKQSHQKGRKASSWALMFIVYILNQQMHDLLID
jgi:hypothetical protein